MPGWPLHLLQSLGAILVIAGPGVLGMALVHRLSRGRHRLAERWLAALVLGPNLQIGALLVLGFAHRFGLVEILIVDTVFLVAAIALIRRDGFGEWWPGRVLTTIEAAVLMVVVLAGALALADLLVRPTRNFDSLAYHLPVMAHWVSTHSLGAFVALGQVALYPSHFELLSTAATLPMRQDLFISLPNLLAWLQLGLAVALLAQRMGAGPSASAVGAGLLMVVPSVLSRLDAIQPDILLAATFVTALVFLLREEESGRSCDVVVILLCVGALPGLKLSGPIFVLMLLPFLVLAPAKSLARECGPRWSSAVGSRGFAVVAVGAAFVAGAWYVRNWIALGNPLGDMELQVLGTTLFDGSVTRSELQRGALRHVFRPGVAEDWKIVSGVFWEGLREPTVLLALGCFPALAWRAFWRVRLLILVLVLATAFLYWNTPYSGDNGVHGWRITPWMEVGLRYGFPALSLIAVLGSVGLGRWPVLTWGALVVLVGSSAWTVLATLEPRTVALYVAVLVAFALAVVSSKRPAAEWSRRGVLSLGVGVVLLGILGLAPAREARERSRVERFGEIARIVDERLTTQDVVAAVNTQSFHLAGGSDWRRRLVVPELPAPGEEEAWVDQLDAMGVTAILLGHKDPERGSVADARRVRDFLRDSGNFVLIHDYETRTKDLALLKRVRGR